MFFFKNTTHTLCLFNIAMGNGPCIEVYLLKMVIFHGYVNNQMVIILRIYGGSRTIFIYGRYIYIYMCIYIYIMIQVDPETMMGFVDGGKFCSRQDISAMVPSCSITVCNTSPLISIKSLTTLGHFCSKHWSTSTT